MEKKKRSGFKIEMPGFELSTDYSLLFDLIHSGTRIPAWIVYSADYEEPIYDIVEVKMSYMSDRPSIGVRGIGYEAYSPERNDFIDNCKYYSLHFIIPNENHDHATKTKTTP
jgi:hypothetical protein